MEVLRLLDLPAELLHQVLIYLDSYQLSKVAATCRALHILCQDDRLWQAFVHNELPHPPHDSGPCESFRELYITHHAYWFLPRSKIWFGDGDPTGKLMISRYDAKTGSIVAHTVTAQRGPHTLEFWERNPEVIIHSFDPRVSLDLSRPVLRLDLGCALGQGGSSNGAGSGMVTANHYSQEVIMPISSDPGLFESFMLCKALPEEAITSQTQVWPPQRFPSKTRTRNDSPGNFRSQGHRPARASEVSEQSFRLHKWVEYTGRRSSANTIATLASSMSTLGALAGSLGFTGPFHGGGGTNHRFPESINTFATLPEWCYTPTADKPWQGIWCGDYSGHGCEFLVITQPDKHAEKPLPDGMSWLRSWLRGSRRPSTSSNGSYASAFEDLQPIAASSASETTDSSDEPSDGEHADNRDGPTGRLEAIKLTGDPNIPRGEYTFIAPDLGHGGFVRTADEAAFRGARVVRSAGHIAGRGFREAQWTPSQLIMVSHDRLAQFWEGFGHISFYQRVDLDALLRL